MQRTARVAGLKGFVTPTLERIHRRRIELWGATFVLLASFAISMVLLSFDDEAPSWFDQFGGTVDALRVGLILLVGAFIVYVLDKERQLEKLAKYVTNEQVLSAALANRLKEISLLSDAGKAVGSTLELEDVLSVILNAAFELLEADEGSIMLVEADELVVAAATGHPGLFVGDRRPVGEGLAGYVASSREPLLVEGKAQPVDALGDLARGEEIASAMLVPMAAKSELLGVLNLNVTTGARRYTEYELRALGLFAEHAAMAIRHARSMAREREMRMHVAEIDRLRTELVGSMAHDLKTPLTSILGVAKMLSEHSDQLDAERTRDFLVSIERQSQRLLALIERLLDAARSQAQHLPLSPGRLDLVPQIEEIAHRYTQAYGRPVQVLAGTTRIEAFADPDAVEQVLANLLENAMKHTPADAEVSIDVGSDGEHARVSVRDTGPGIPPDVAESLFLPFRRGASGATGTGLGLFVVSNLVRAMGGEIAFSSPAGGGACFTLTLPVQQTAGSQQVVS